MTPTRTLIPTLLILLATLPGCAPKPSAPTTRPTLDPAALRTNDEGMWTLDNLPRQEMEQRFGFAPSPQWLEHVQRSACNVGGASGAFVSPDGLVLTNHHVALNQLQKMSSPQKDLVKDGFIAHRRQDEARCPDIEIKVLMSTQDVTARILKAVEAAPSSEEKSKLRKAEIARIEKESTDTTGLHSRVITLYQGGEYWLYRSKKYTDVRLVMAPELQAAFFGGDEDNFTYPRYVLDFAFFRVYENDKPAKIEHFLSFKADGPQEGELVFVAGHPGVTLRLRTVAQMEFDRDVRIPLLMKILEQRRKALYDYAARGPEPKRQVGGAIFSIENALKAYRGRYQNLLDPTVIKAKQDTEAALRQAVQARPDLAKSTGPAWDRIAEVMKKAAPRHAQHTYRQLSGSTLAGIAREIVQYVAEVEKPNDQRFEEFRQSSLDSTRRKLLSPAPIYPEMEEQQLAAILANAREALGANDPLIVAALEGRTPAAQAHHLISGTRLADPAVRKSLIESGRAAVEKSDDPLIQWARRLDPIWRQERDWLENQIQSVELTEGQKIAAARFALYGKSLYPDATGTLRLSFGRVAGYDLGTTKVPYKTTLYGMLDRAASFDNKYPFTLPDQVAARLGKFDLKTPICMVATNDIIGGNSGSPVIDREGNYVGLVFDSNLQALGRAYSAVNSLGRAISVHAAVIRESLANIYPAPELLKELMQK